MSTNPFDKPLEKAFSLGTEFLNDLDTQPVGARLSYEELKSLWSWDLPEKGMPAEEVIEELNESAIPGLNLNQSGRFFAWVIGGSHPSAIAAAGSRPFGTRMQVSMHAHRPVELWRKLLVRG